MGLRELMNLAHHGNEYFQKKEPWKNENSSTLYLCANLCRTLAILCEPFLPFTAEKIWKTLNLEGSVHDQDWNAASELGVKEGHKIGKVEVLFKRIEDEEIEDFESKFLKLKLREGKEKMEYIEFDEFEKLDIRIGRIKGVRDHPRADKLYLLNVDLGSLGERQLVAGIKEAYKKEELIGKDIVVVANLKPVKLRGQKSEGMLLAADVDGKPVLLTIDKEVKQVKPGTKIR